MVEVSITMESGDNTAFSIWMAWNRTVHCGFSVVVGREFKMMLSCGEWWVEVGGWLKRVVVPGLLQRSNEKMVYFSKIEIGDFGWRQGSEG